MMLLVIAAGALYLLSSTCEAFLESIDIHETHKHKLGHRQLTYSPAVHQSHGHMPHHSHTSVSSLNLILPRMKLAPTLTLPDMSCQPANCMECQTKSITMSALARKNITNNAELMLQMS